MISFIIPALNEEKVIEKLILCLREYKGPKEIIVSDGRSTDRTVAIATPLADTVIVHNGTTRQTIAQGRNEGAAKAKGDYLVFMDSDDYIPDINEFFAKALKLFEADKKLVALTVSYKVLPEFATLTDRIIFWCVAFNYYILNNILGIGGSGGEFQMIKADAFRKVNGFNEEMAAAEDCDIFWRLAKIGRTRCERSLAIYHTGRRGHKIGWPKLLYQWSTNAISAYFFKKSVSKEWTEIR